MLFSRRNPVSWRERLRIALWPRRSWSRSGLYVAKRVLRLTSSPHSIAAGVAAGVFASFTPFIGFHFLLAFAIAYLIAGNFLSAALGTFAGNPLTFPFIWASTYATGKFILSGARTTGNGGHHRIAELVEHDVFSVGLGGMFERLARIWEPVLKPMTVGAIPLGIVFAIAFYILTRWAAIKFRQARQKRLSQRQRERAATAVATGSDARP
ncbi:MAG: membrane protein [Alphaproteobacteria bacterium]|nr:MAG: membrane protein [Alphaproteobacteria bacterium]